MPSALLATTWSVEWANSISAAQVKKSFDLCGLVPPSEFKIENLHQPLRDVFERNLSLQEWTAKHGGTISTSSIEATPGWRCFEGKNAFFYAVYELTAQDKEFKAWKIAFAKEMVEFLQEDEATKPLFIDNDKFIIENGTRLTKGFFEFYAVSSILRRNLHIITFDEDDKSLDRLEFGKDFGELTALYVRFSPFKVMVPDTYHPTDLAVVENGILLFEADGNNNNEQDEYEEDDEQQQGEQDEQEEYDSEYDQDEEYAEEEEADEVEGEGGELTYTDTEYLDMSD